MNLGIVAFAFAGAAAFASCSGDGGGAQGAGAAGSAGASTGGRAGSAGVKAAGAAGAGSPPGLVPFDPVWTKTTPPDWVPYPIPATPCDGCVYVNPDGVDRLVDSVRAQRADGRWSVFGDSVKTSEAHKAAWAIDLVDRVAYRVDDGCFEAAPSDKFCFGAVPSVDSGFLVFGMSSSTRAATFVRRLETGETKVMWRKTKKLDANGLEIGASLLATGMAYPYAYWVEAGIYRLDLRDGTVVANGACDVIEAVTVARNGLACCAWPCGVSGGSTTCRCRASTTPTPPPIRPCTALARSARAPRPTGEAGSISIIPSPFFSSSVGVPMGGPYAQLL